MQEVCGHRCGLESVLICLKSREAKDTVTREAPLGPSPLFKPQHAPAPWCEGRLKQAPRGSTVSQVGEGPEMQTSPRPRQLPLLCLCPGLETGVKVCGGFYSHPRSSWRLDGTVDGQLLIGHWHVIHAFIHSASTHLPSVGPCVLARGTSMQTHRRAGPALLVSMCQSQRRRANEETGREPHAGRHVISAAGEIHMRCDGATGSGARTQGRRAGPGKPLGWVKLEPRATGAVNQAGEEQTGSQSQPALGPGDGGAGVPWGMGGKFPVD